MKYFACLLLSFFVIAYAKAQTNDVFIDESFNVFLSFIKEGADLSVQVCSREDFVAFTNSKTGQPTDPLTTSKKIRQGLDSLDATSSNLALAYFNMLDSWTYFVISRVNNKKDQDSLRKRFENLRNYTKRAGAIFNQMCEAKGRVDLVLKRIELRLIDVQLYPEGDYDKSLFIYPDYHRLNGENR